MLQRDKPLPVWGRADAGEKITVNFHGQTGATTATGDGRWIVFLNALPADAVGTDLVVTGKNTVTLTDIVVGEVWLCSGQSNMEFTVRQAANADSEIAAAKFPLIRHVKIGRTVAATPADSVATTGWLSATVENAGSFSAIGYFFAREIFQKLGVPIGLVNSSWGGTPIESWMSPAALANSPNATLVGERWAQVLADYPAKKTKFDAELIAWTTAETVAKAAPGPVAARAGAKNPAPAPHVLFLKANPKPRAPRGPGDSWTPAGLFNGMINPLLPYAIRGALWYQGESNTDRAAEYPANFTAMITAWRDHFGQGDFPFYFVQLANFKAASEAAPNQWPLLREAQTRALSLPNTGQAIAIDLGNPDDIHPVNKQEVGRRLALLAKSRVYGITTDDTGPTFAGATREGAAMRVTFTHASAGLTAYAKPVQSLELAGANRIFFPATARIERDTLLVAAPEVKEPVAVRYAWKNSPDANVYNGAGLPAGPFRSDDW